MLALTGGRARAEVAAAPAKAEPKAEAKAETKASPTTGEKRTVKENVKQLGNEISDPGTLQRIKAHEQDLEKKVESKRARQRKDHGAAQPNDAVDLAKSLDKPEGAGKVTPAKTIETKPGAKSKAEAAPPAAPPPAPAKPAAPAQK
jgi:hypothetical protein